MSLLSILSASCCVRRQGLLTVRRTTQAFTTFANQRRIWYSSLHQTTTTGSVIIQYSDKYLQPRKHQRMDRTLATMKTNSSIAMRSIETAGSMKNGFTVKQRQLQLQMQRRSVMVEVTQTASGTDQSSLENGKETASTATDTAAAARRGEGGGEGAVHLLPLKITESCWRRVRFLTEKKGDSLEDTYLRVYVDAGGCSGFSYKFEFDTNENLDDDEDIIYSEPSSSDDANDADAAALHNANNNNNNGGGVPRVVVDEASLELIQGSTIDYVQEMIKSAFEVRDNPQSESACGCGSSFAVKNFASNPAID